MDSSSPRNIVFLFLLLVPSGCSRPTTAPLAGSKWAAALRNDNSNVRKKAAFTLGNIGMSDPAVLPALIEALHDRDAGVRREAILALLKCGSEAKQASSILAEIERQDLDAQVRTCAAEALHKLEEIR